jgi:predicted nucleic acid-binding protein
MSDRVFFDTNVLIYILASSDSRGKRAEQLFFDGGIVSVQVLDEFTDVARRKLRMPWDDVKDALKVIRIFCPDPVGITIDTHELALRIAEEHEIRIYDALIVASALEAKCDVLYSEDFQDRQVIDGKLTIRNPFA